MDEKKIEKQHEEELETCVKEVEQTAKHMQEQNKSEEKIQRVVQQKIENNQTKAEEVVSSALEFAKNAHSQVIGPVDNFFQEHPKITKALVFGRTIIAAAAVAVITTFAPTVGVVIGLGVVACAGGIIAKLPQISNVASNYLKNHIIPNPEKMKNKLYQRKQVVVSKLRQFYKLFTKSKNQNKEELKKKNVQQHHNQRIVLFQLSVFCLKKIFNTNKNRKKKV